MQKINLFGMDLTDYSLRESLGILDRYLNNGALNTILYMSAKMLVGANISQEQKNWIEDIDLVIWSDAEILEHAGIKARNRIHEVENKEFMREFLKRLGKNKKPAYLLAESEEELERLKEDLLYLRGDLNIIGGSVVDDEEMVVETDIPNVINDINLLAPTAIISRISFERQEKFMVETRKFLNAEVWLALNNQMILNEDRPMRMHKLANKWYHVLFSRQIAKYNNLKK